MQYERVREREPEPARVRVDPWYEELLTRDRAHGRAPAERRDLHSRRGPALDQNRNARVKYLLHTMKPGTAVADMNVFVHEIWSTPARTATRAASLSTRLTGAATPW